MYQQTIDLNMIPSGVPPVIHVSQYEAQLNAFTFRLYNGAEAFNIPSNAAVLMNGLKPDGNVFSFAAASTSGNTAVFNCEQQMVPLPGRVVCELRVRTSSEIIGTCNFLLQVEESPLHDDSVISETTIPLIEQAIDIAANLAEYIETTLSARDEAVASAAAAKESEDHAAIYNSNVEQTYNSIETAKQNANTAAASATVAAAKLSNISATATTLSEGSSATASYDSNTGVMTFGIPRGATGESGIQTPISGMYALAVDADGYLYCYSNDEITESMFSYDEEEGNLYWMSPTTPIVTSVSGNMVTFVNKSSAENAVDVTSDIAPVQSFNGYDKPWPAGGGKNLLDINSIVVGNTTNWSVDVNGDTLTVTHKTEYVTGTPVFALNQPSGTYVVSISSININGQISLYVNGAWVKTINNGDTFTIDAANTNDIRFSAWVNQPTIITKIQIESGSTPTAYAPYSNICPISGWMGANVHVSPTTDAADGTTYSITFPSEAGTVYGGTLDVVSGELVVDRAMVDMGTLTWNMIAVSQGNLFRASVNKIKQESDSLNLMCDRYATVIPSERRNYTVSKSTGKNVDVIDNTYSDAATFKAAMPGVQLVYELAEPITYHLTPQNIKILKGTNNIWSESGDVTVKYNRWELE